MQILPPPSKSSRGSQKHGSSSGSSSSSNSSSGDSLGDDEQQLVAVSDADADARQQHFVCLVMEYMDKGCLTELVAQEQLSVEELLKAFTQVLKALAYVHSRGLVHCDIKLDNILVSGS